ncbi:MAG: UbiA family prenyltransferase [Methylacidiphilales bacterium]|nr:UbiA family prenyltransferase [Candidatus Methylacidiphilales bacterium]
MSKLFRVRDWWEHKIACALGTVYGIALLLGIPLTTLWPFLPAVIVALFFAASYVSVLNDLTDWPEDLAGGKVAIGTERNLGMRLGALGFCMVGGFCVLFWFRHYPLTCLLYLSNWIVFALYSIPPVRLKARGAWGLLMDSCGSHVIPTLWGLTLISEGTDLRLPVPFVISLVFWAIALGLRGILLHQIRDYENDQQIGVRTFVVRVGSNFAKGLVVWFLFPIEIVTLVLVLIQVDSPWAWPLLGFYFVVVTVRYFHLGIKIALVTPSRGFHPVFEEYYPFLYPATFLLAYTSASSLAWLILGLHFLLFPKSIDSLFAGGRKWFILKARTLLKTERS